MWPVSFDPDGSLPILSGFTGLKAFCESRGSMSVFARHVIAVFGNDKNNPHLNYSRRVRVLTCEDT